MTGTVTERMRLVCVIDGAINFLVYITYLQLLQNNNNNVNASNKC